MSDKKPKTIGDLGEKAAVEFLEGKGFRIVGRKYKYRNGELDIVARSGAFLVFVEVKTVDLTYTPVSAFGEPETWLTPRKQKFMKQCAHHYLWKEGIKDVDCRFDLITVRLYEGHTEIQHIENAFW